MIDDRSCLVGNPAIFFFEIYAANRLWNTALYVNTVFHILTIITIRNNIVPKDASRLFVTYSISFLADICLGIIFKR